MDGFSIFMTVFGGLLLAGVAGLIIWNSIRERYAKREDGGDLNNDD